MSAQWVLGVDIGGTKVLAGAVDVDGVVHDVARRVTPHRSKAPAVVEDTIAEAVESLRGQYDVAAVGVGAAGFVDREGERVLFAPHLSWRDEPLRKALEERLELPVLVDNDANATAWAELRFGAARGYRDVLCITLGTGIGGALVVGGKVFRGANGLAGEFGHMQVVPAGRRCECGNRGCWEQYSSGNAVVREAQELVRAESPAAARLVELVAGDPDRVTGAVVTQAAEDGDEAAEEILRAVGTWLGTGLAGIAAGFDPELIVIGGGVSDAGDLLLEPARLALARNLTGRGHRPVPPVVAAALGPRAGMVGAADLARALV
jgi:glucokinase